jgi:hypothetical protein
MDEIHGDVHMASLIVELVNIYTRCCVECMLMSTLRSMFQNAKRSCCDVEAQIWRDIQGLRAVV